MLLKKGCYWWSEHGDFPPEDERKRTPSASRVLESYRTAGNVKFPQLAGEMHLSVEMLRRIFHQGEGLDSIERRRELARRLKIPPELLGLDSLHWERQGTCWWTQDGYHAFSMGEDGYPHPGEVVRWYRKQKRKRDQNEGTRSLETRRFGRCLYSQSFCRECEQNGKALYWIRLYEPKEGTGLSLGNSSALLGLDATKHERGIPHIPSSKLLLSGGLTDDMLVMFEQRQEEIFTEYFKKHGQDKVGEVNWWIPYLQDEALPLARYDQQYVRVRHIEQRYHDFLEIIAGGQLNFAEAILQANTLIAIAEEMEDTERLIVALVGRARTHREQGRLFYNMTKQIPTGRLNPLRNMQRKTCYCSTSHGNYYSRGGSRPIFYSTTRTGT